MEREVKIKIKSISKLEKKLKKLGAVYIGQTKEENIIYDDTEKNFIKRNERLRVRNNELITYKRNSKNIKGVKVQEEHEYFCKKANDLFKKLGYIAINEYNKIRKTYLLGTTKVELDRIRELPRQFFVEIEGKNIETILKIVNILELPKKFIQESYHSMVMKRKK